MRAILVRTARLLALLLVPCLSAETRAQTGGIVADPSVTPVALSSFAGLTTREIWDRVDGLEYWAIPLAPPVQFYALIDASSPQVLRTTLHQRTANHSIFPYTHNSLPGAANHVVDTWDVVVLADAHPQNTNRVLDLYLNGTFDRQLRGVTTDPRYDREHTWPKSLGFPDNSIKNAAYSDCHHLMAAYQSYNGSRSNKPYGTGEASGDLRRPTLENVGRGGSLDDEPASSNYSFGGSWQTWIGRRGDVARAMFYMDVRYEGGTRDGGVGEPQLELTSDPAEITQRNVWSTSGTAFMGHLDVLLQWHRDDPVDDLERRRNAVVFLFQGNRNPFVDHPEWVPVLYGGAVPPPEVAVVPWINELHYDNDGPDQNEFVEVAGPAGLDLSGWTIVLYNGTGGRAYQTVPLSGVFTDQQAGVGTLSFAIPGIQNGPADGLALVSPTNQIVELLSYEGTFTATDGPASGMAATDIAVAETGTTPVGQSLQKTGQGRRGGEFAWMMPAVASPGGVNAAQTLQ